MFRTLMTARRFAPLFWCQFFSAFNDNFLKNALAFLILFGIGGQADAHAGVLVTLASAVFIGPFHPVRTRRPVGRPVRQGPDGPAAQVRRDLRGRCRRARLPAAFRADPVRRARPVRDDRGPVRPDQVRDPSGPSPARGAARRQRPGGGGDLPGDSAGDDRGGRGLGDGRVRNRVRRPGDGLRRPVLALGPDDPGDRGGGTGPARRPERRPLHLRAAARPLGRHAPVARLAHRELVLARRRGGAVAAARPGPRRLQRHRDGDHAAPGALLHRHRIGLRPRLVARQRPDRAAADAGGRGSDGAVRPRSRLDGRPSPGAPRSRSGPSRSCRPATACAPGSTSSDSRSRAASTSSRPSRPCRPGPRRRCGRESSARSTS